MPGFCVRRRQELCRVGRIWISMYTINASNLNTRWAIGADLDAVCHGMNIF